MFIRRSRKLLNSNLWVFGLLVVLVEAEEGEGDDFVEGEGAEDEDGEAEELEPAEGFVLFGGGGVAHEEDPDYEGSGGVDGGSGALGGMGLPLGGGGVFDHTHRKEETHTNRYHQRKLNQKDLRVRYHLLNRHNRIFQPPMRT